MIIATAIRFHRLLVVVVLILALATPSGPLSLTRLVFILVLFLVLLLSASPDCAPLHGDVTPSKLKSSRPGVPPRCCAAGPLPPHPQVEHPALRHPSELPASSAPRTGMNPSRQGAGKGAATSSPSPRPDEPPRRVRGGNPPPRPGPSLAAPARTPPGPRCIPSQSCRGLLRSRSGVLSHAPTRQAPRRAVGVGGLMISGGAVIGGGSLFLEIEMAL